MYDFDIVVLGAGPGGYVAAIRASQYGKKVALIEARELGGTCLNRGCIPTKALLHCAEVYEQTGSASVFGVKASDVGYDYSAMAAYKDMTVQKLVSGIEALEKAYKVTVIRGGQSFLAVVKDIAEDGRLVLESGETLSFEEISLRIKCLTISQIS